MALFVFVIRYGCLIAFGRFSPFAGSGHAGIVLIRREMDGVILSALVTGGDKAEYYSEAVFCRALLPALIRRKGPTGGEGSEGLAWLMEHRGVHVLINRLCQHSRQPGASRLHLVPPKTPQTPCS